MRSYTNKPEVLSFSFQEIYLSRILIQSREHLVLYIKMLSEKYGHPAEDIIFNHDYEDAESPAEFKNNFSKNGSYDWIKEIFKLNSKVYKARLV